MSYSFAWKKMAFSHWNGKVSGEVKNGPLWNSRWNLHSERRLGIIKDSPEEAWKIEKKFISFIKLVSMWYFFLSSWGSFTYFMYSTNINYRLWILVLKGSSQSIHNIFFLEIYSGCRHKLTLFWDRLEPWQSSIYIQKASLKLIENYLPLYP